LGSRCNKVSADHAKKKMGVMQIAQRSSQQKQICGLLEKRCSKYANTGYAADGVRKHRVRSRRGTQTQGSQHTRYANTGYAADGVRKHRVRSRRGTQTQGTQQTRYANTGYAADGVRKHRVRSRRGTQTQGARVKCVQTSARGCLYHTHICT
jgi:hypothetical protein